MLVYPFQGSRKEGHEARYWRSRLASRLRVFMRLPLERFSRFWKLNHRGTETQRKILKSV
jgi:hypothetical protein